MKRVLFIILTMLCLMGLWACGANNDTQQTTETVEATNDTAEESAEADASTEAIDEDTDVEAAATETTEDSAVEEVKEEAEPTDAVEEVTEDGLAADVDRAKIEKYETPKTLYVQKSVNVRKGPSTKYEKVDHFEINKEVSAVGRYDKNGWFMISYKDGYAFISNDILAETEVDLEALKAEQEAAALAAIEQQKAAETAQAQNPDTSQQTQPAVQPAMPPAGILFIGDSRCVQMQEAVGGGNSSWICENSKGYKWLSENAIQRADECVGKGTKVVICLGVNDTDHAYDYAALINQKAAEWAARGAKTYYVSVNPVWENPYVTEEQVELFNSTIVGSLSGVRWIDTHSYLMATGYRLVDGLHYDTDTYIKIFNAIVGSLK